MTTQNHSIPFDKSTSISDYEKPTLTIKYFLLESNIAGVSNIDPTQTGDNVPSVPDDWWD